jgi:hypothetical protein
MAVLKSMGHKITSHGGCDGSVKLSKNCLMLVSGPAISTKSGMKEAHAAFRPGIDFWL